MKNKHLLLLVVLLLTALTLSACSRSASTPPPSQPTEASGFPIPGTQTMGIFDTFATQTAIALQQGGGAPQNTPEPPPPPAEVQPTEPQQPLPQPEPTQEAAPPGPVVEAPPPPAPEPVAPPEVPTATPGIPSTYTLQKGEHLYCLARRFNVNPAELLNLNGLGNNTVLQPGREIRIPQTGATFPGSRTLLAHPTNYTVRSGDTVYSIACAFGDADPNMIIQANNLSAPYDVGAGQTLYIP